MIREAIKLLIDNPSLSNREIARQLNVTETTIRYWKKQPFWQQEWQKLINERAEAMGVADEKRRKEYREKLQEQRRHLEKFRDAIEVMAARLITIANTALAELCEHPDPVKACYIATKSGTHIQSKIAIDAIMTIVKLNQEIFQFYIILDYLDNLNDDDDR